MIDDERNGNGPVQRPGQYGDPKKKYMHMLQRVADRQISEVTIELDDLQKVRTFSRAFPWNASLISLIV